MKIQTKTHWGACLAVAVLLLAGHALAQEPAVENTEEERNVPTVGVATAKGVRPDGGSSISQLADQLPFAYYPSRNQMEVAVALKPDRLAKSRPTEVRVRVLDVKSGKEVAKGVVPLDGLARGQAVFDVPDFADGEYAVEYGIGKHVKRSPKTFKRIHFPFEKTAYGESHQVYPPFTPVAVDGRTVRVVQRAYTLNGFGLFDSVISQGRELLATPMRVVATDRVGKTIKWANPRVSGEKLFDDQAVFTTEITSAQAVIRSKVIVEEDGCARVDWTIEPGTARGEIADLVVEIPVKDSEAPLFHFVGTNSIRYDYGGKTPKGGKIVWDLSPNRARWVPITWKVESGPEDGTLWDSLQVREHGNQEKKLSRPFVPYFWVGAEERGLAWFGDSERGYSVVPGAPIQSLVRKNGELILRIHIIQKPTLISEPRHLAFGLMASPGKPMEKEFRTRPFANGIGPVSCWGGWTTRDKYPENYDWSVVDKIQEIRKNGKFTPEESAWFDAKYAEVNTRWPGRMNHDMKDGRDWQSITKVFANRAATDGRTQSGTYFEVHATDIRLPEWEVFQDEWSSAEFNRFQKKPAFWGVWAPSYQNFALYFANEWMKRGVSLYFDCTNPKRCFNPLFPGAQRDADGSVLYGVTLSAQRDYYRRIYKLLSQWNESGKSPYPIDFTLHMTNTQVLPMTTWATALLDLEQRSYTEDPALVPPEVIIPAKSGQPAQKPSGYQLPWPTDYTRTVTLGRQAGAIPLALDFVSGHGRREAENFTPQMMLRDWAMRRIHDIRKGADYMKSAALAKDYEKVLQDFGYGQTDRVEHHNYWEEKPFVTVSDDRIKWLALSKKTGQPSGLLLLQSYSRTEAIKVPVTFSGAAVFQDVETREIIPAPNGQATIAMPANFGTRMFLVSGENLAR